MTTFFPVTTSKSSAVYDCYTCTWSSHTAPPHKLGFGNKNADILIVEEKVRAFTGVGLTEDQEFFRDTLRQFRVNIRDCFVTSALQCIPTKKREPAIKDFKCCFGVLEKVIKQVKPKVVFLMGSGVCKAVLNDGLIIKLRGYSIKSKKYNCYFVPVLDPKKALVAWEQKPVFVQDIANGLSLRKQTLEFIDFDKGNQVLTDFDEVCDVLQTIRKDKLKFAVDWETYPLRPYNKSSVLISCGIALGVQESYTFLMENHWTEKQWEVLKKEFQQLFTSDCVKTFFNYKFEKDWAVVKLGAGITGNIRDMMLASYLFDERKGTHNLEFQSLVTFGVGKIKEADKYKKDMRKCPIPLLHDYCGRDVRLTFALEEKHWSRMDDRCMSIYENFLLPGTGALLESETEGVLISPVLMKKVRDKVEEEQEKVLGVLRTTLVKYRLLGDVTQPIEKVLNSPGQISNFLFNVLKLAPIKKTPKGGNCVDKGVLEHYAATQPFCKALVKYRDLAKLLSTYVDGLKDVIYTDGLLHPSFNLHLTETGRLSGSRPNMQNIPKRKNAFVREMFVPPKGHLIMTFDYSGAEVRGMAMESKDKTLVKYIKDNYDMHQAWTDKIYKVTGVEVTRSAVKMDFVFLSFYGGSYKLSAKNLGTDEEIMKQLQNELFQEFPGMKKWQERQKLFYEKKGYVESLFGRRRHAPLTHNQIINSPIQSLASDFTLLSLIESRRRGYRMGWTIHDDNSYYIPEDKVKSAYNEIREIMVGWDFDFVNVPLEVDCEVGEDWFNLVPIEEIL